MPIGPGCAGSARLNAMFSGAQRGADDTTGRRQASAATTCSACGRRERTVMKIQYSKAWCVGMAAKEASSNSEVDAGPRVEIAPDARAGMAPCGECHLQAGETCDICGACAESAKTC